MLGISFRNNMIKRFLGSPNIGKIRHFKDLTRNICLNCCISKMWSLICLAIFLFKPVKYCFKYWVSKYVSVLFLDNIIFAPNKILTISNPILKEEAWWVFKFRLLHIEGTLHNLWKKKVVFPFLSLFADEQKKDTRCNM